MTLAACLIVKDEARDIAEWIAYHGAIGVDTFLVYDNGSLDGTQAVLRAAAGVYDIRLTPWRTAAVNAQVQAYQHAIRTNRTEFDWIAFIDSDEFIVLHQPHTLRSLSDTAASVIGINWAMFGSNGHAHLPTGLVIESFTRRSVPWFPPNRHVKCLVRPGADPVALNPHAFDVAGPAIRPGGAPLEWQCDAHGNLLPGLSADPPDYTIAQVNHYFTRSRAHWALKTARGYPNPASRPKLREFDVYDRNDVLDQSALEIVSAVRARRSQILARVLQQAHGPAATLDAWRTLYQADALAHHGPLIIA